MKKLFSILLLAALLCTPQAKAEKVQMAVTMNSTSRTMQLVPFQGGEAVEVGEPSSYKYTFEAEPGRYLLTGFNSSGLRNGTLVVDLQAGSDINVYTVSAKATNSGWVLGDDYTVKASVVSSAMEEKEFLTGVDKATQTAVTFLALKGDTYSVSLVPNAIHSSEGYLTYSESNPLTANKTVSKAIPQGHTFTLAAPKGATVFVGSKVRHFVPFESAQCIATSEDQDCTVYTYVLAENTDYTYRVTMEGKVTTAAKFKMPAEDYSITVTEEDMEGDPHMIDRDPASNNNYNVADVFLNAGATGEIELNAGQTFRIVNLRNWEIVDGISSNYFIEPDYHYTVLNENGQPDQNVASVSADGLLTAKNAGTAIVLVTYDALNAPSQAGGPLFGAIWPENTGVIVVKVGASETGIEPNFLINSDLNETSNDKLSGQSLDAELDVIYFTGDHAEYTFAPANATSVTIANPEVGETSISYTGFSTDNVKRNSDGTITLYLSEGRNIVRLSNGSGSEYQVVRAKKLSYTLTNLTTDGAAPKPGDQVSVLFSGIYHPCNKLAGVYNMSAKVQYSISESEVVTSKQNQYQFASNEAARTITLTIPEDWNEERAFTINKGVLIASGYGDPYGGHRDITYEVGKNPNFTAEMHTAYFGYLPDVTIYEADKQEQQGDPVIATFEELALEPESHWSGDANGDDWFYGMGTQQTFKSGTYLFENYYAEDYDYWMGFGYTNSTSTVYTQLSDQYNSCVGIGYNNSANYCVAYPDGSMWGETPTIHVDGEARVVPGFYITNTAWVVNSILNGDGYTEDGFKAGDYFKITIDALDAAGNVTASRNFCLADYRFENEADRYYIDNWAYVDLSGLGEASGFKFSFDGSRKNSYGLTTPTYFCIDNFGDNGTENVREEGSYDGDSSGLESYDSDSMQSPAIYNLQGMRVSEMTTPGVYIVNGRKVLKR